MTRCIHSCFTFNQGKLLSKFCSLLYNLFIKSDESDYWIIYMFPCSLFLQSTTLLATAASMYSRESCLETCFSSFGHVNMHICALLRNYSAPSLCQIFTNHSAHHHSYHAPDYSQDIRFSGLFAPSRTHIAHTRTTQLLLKLILPVAAAVVGNNKLPIFLCLLGLSIIITRDSQERHGRNEDKVGKAKKTNNCCAFLLRKTTRFT